MFEQRPSPSHVQATPGRTAGMVFPPSPLPVFRLMLNFNVNDELLKYKFIYARLFVFHHDTTVPGNYQYANVKLSTPSLEM